MDGMTSIDAAFKRAKEFGQTAIAITEHGNCASIFDARKASKKYGVKYIPGCEFYFVDDVKDDKAKRCHLILLAKNEPGYRNLLRLNYEGFAHCKYVAVANKVFPQIDWAMLEKYHEGVICLTACGSGILAREMFKVNEHNEWNEDECNAKVATSAVRLKGIFGDDFYLEVQTHSLKKYRTDRKTQEVENDSAGNPIIAVDQDCINRKLVILAQEMDLPLVATCDVHYLEKTDAKFHDMLLAIGDKKPLSDPTRHRFGIEEFYMKSGDEVYNHFVRLFDKKVAQQVCATTIEIADKCEDSAYIDSDVTRFPKFDVKQASDYSAFLKWKATQKFDAGIQEDNAYLRYQCVISFKERFKHLGPEDRVKYKQRIVDEIKVLEGHQFSSYMLIVADFIREARSRKIRVGPGRGSVGGSLVAYLLGIHEVDPIQYGLIFERFHNKEKKAFPDIDTDFAPSGRDQIEEYIVGKYGREKVAGVSNLSRMTPKVVIKDLARSLELGGNKHEAFQIANEITASVPDNPSLTFDGALEGSEDFRKFCVKYPDIERYGRKLCGLERAYGIHAAGIVIGDIDLSTYVPLRYDKHGKVSVQYEKNRCEAVGLIKMDLLGLEHLDIIDETIRNVRAMGEDCKEPEELAPFDDKAVWDMISEGRTACIFQIERQGGLCRQIKPRNVQDLALINALCRPSAVKSRMSYIARRDGKEKVTYIHECLKPALEDTLGICVYEEQMMKLANCVAGWNLNKADGLRKLTKLKEKGKEFAAKLQKEFVDDTVKVSHVSREIAFKIWDDIIDPFSKYGFNSAHAIFYSINGYYTAYYKYHYPAAFMAAVLRSEVSKTSSNKDTINMLKKEAVRMGIKIATTDINMSGPYFTVASKNLIRMGLMAAKGVGAKAVEEIIKIRQEHKFVSFADFLYRTSSSLVRKPVIQALAKAGAFDSLGITRKNAHDLYAEIRPKVNKHAERNSVTGKDAWALMNDLKLDIKGLGEEWTKKETLQGELETLGEYVSGGIQDMYEGFFSKGVTFNRIRKMVNKTPVRIEALVESVTQSKTKTGKSKGGIYVRCNLLDINKESIQLTIWSNTWKAVKDLNIEGRPIRAMCRVNLWNGVNTLVLDNIEKVGG
jgi:DNA polymerase-3 subunit alpha